MKGEVWWCLSALDEYLWETMSKTRKGAMESYLWIYGVDSLPKDISPVRIRVEEVPEKGKGGRR